MEKGMENFTSLTCPNCGGKLDVSKNTSFLVCQYCGTEHFIHREENNILLEAFARCPVCNRNDKVEKVSAIVERGAALSYKLSPPMQPNDPDTSEKRLIMGCTSYGILLYGIAMGIFLISGGICYQISPPPYHEKTPDSIITGLITGVLTIAIFWFTYRFVKKFSKKKLFDEKEKYLRNKPKWDSAIERWEKLYYCARDGIVYNPETGETINIDSIQEYIYKYE
jgi:predicted RNA-binding Zn-ribbon protein involved in translation (DUF1610 family)